MIMDSKYNIYALAIFFGYLLLIIIVAFKIGKLLYKRFSLKRTIFYTLILIVGLNLISRLFFIGTGITYLIFQLLYTIKRKLSKRFSILPTLKKSTKTIYFKSRKGLLKLTNPFRGILIVGGAGSGKSVSFFYPLIQQFIKNEFSGILYDFKSPELSEFAFSQFTENNKSTFAFLNFKNIQNSVRVNPLSPKYLTKQSIAFELATTLINNLLSESIKQKDYWTRSCISVTAGAMWYLRNTYPSYCTLPHLIAMILNFKSADLIGKISSNNETAGMIASLSEAHEMKAEKQIAGVLGTLKNAIAQLNLPEIFYLLSVDEVSLDLNNKETPVFLAIGNDSSLADTYAPIISVIISSCVKTMNQPNKHKSAIILDEAPTLYIPGIEQIPATARSNKIATVFGVQDISQLIHKYGDSNAQVLLSNLGNQFYGRTVNQKSAQMISNLFGKHDVKYQTKSKTSGASVKGMLGNIQNTSNNQSLSESFQQREKLNTSELINMGAGRFCGLVAEGNTNEFIAVQFKKHRATYKEIPNRKGVTEQTLQNCFNTIYQDIESIKNSKVSSVADKYKINLKS